MGTVKNFDHMTLKDEDNFYLQQPEPTKSCLLALKEIILSQDKNISSAWKYRMPFFCYHGKMLCYLWVNKKTLQPYIGIVEGNKIMHPLLIQEKRSRMKILPVDANKDLPLNTITRILKEAISLYKKNN